MEGQITSRDEPPVTSTLLEQVAARSNSPRNEVLAVLDAHGIDLTVGPRQRRSITVLRLRLVGTKTSTSVFDGPFDKTFDFPTGMTVLATETNLRGKTTVLELITWCLRGSPRRLRDAVRSWLVAVELDAIIAGEYIGVRLDLRGETRATVLSAGDPITLAAVTAGDECLAVGVHILAKISGDDDFSSFMNTFMLDRLALAPVAHWHRYEQGHDDGRAQLDRWAALFSVLYLPDGGDANVLGDTHMNGLPGRLLQLYLSIPLAAQRTRIQVARQAVSQVERNALRRTREDVSARADERQQTANRLAEVRARLRSFEAGRSTATGWFEDEDEAAGLLLAAQRRRQNALEAIDAARRARQADQRAHSDALETALARRLFQALSPRHCPRCETPVSAARTEEERTAHRCAVCTSDLDVKAAPTVNHVDVVDAAIGSDSTTTTTGDDDDTVQDADARVWASVAAEEAAKNELAAAEQAVAEARAVLQQARERAESASASNDAMTRRALELDIARLEGALEAIPDSNNRDSDRSLDVRVLIAAEQVIDQTVRTAAASAFEELEQEIVSLGRVFRIDGITAAKTDLAAHLRVTIDGTESPFGKLSRGERLRLRVATVVALLRVGARHGIGTHPGLLLVDSPGSEEVTADVVQALLTALSDLETEMPELQVLVGTAKPAVLNGVRAARVYQAIGEDPLW
jgi:hypothetical protein